MDLIANYESDSEGEDEEVKTPCKLKSYTATFKLNVIKYAKNNDDAKIAKKFGVVRSNVNGWIKQEKHLRQIKDSSPAGKFKK